MIRNRFENSRQLSRHKRSAKVLFVMILALTFITNVETMSATHLPKFKPERLTITTPTAAGGTILQPGNYEVREVKTPSGPVLEFVHQFRNELASELVQAEEEEVVAQVKFTEQPLRSMPTETSLLLAPRSTNALGIQFRDKAVSYVFAPTQVSVPLDTIVGCTNVNGN